MNKAFTKESDHDDEDQDTGTPARPADAALGTSSAGPAGVKPTEGEIMPIFTADDGCQLHYDITGEGPPMVLTPGGREGRRVLDALTGELAQHFRLLTWDRRNTGASDLYFDETRSEQAIWAADLAA